MQFRFDGIYRGDDPEIKGTAHIDEDGTITHITRNKIPMPPGPEFERLKMEVAAMYAATILELLDDYHSRSGRRARAVEREWDARNS